MFVRVESIEYLLQHFNRRANDCPHVSCLLHFQQPFVRASSIAHILDLLDPENCP